jgi:hypothetical protein
VSSNVELHTFVNPRKGLYKNLTPEVSYANTTLENIVKLGAGSDRGTREMFCFEMFF